MDNVKGFTNTRKINQEAAQWILLIEDTPKLSKEREARRSIILKSLGECIVARAKVNEEIKNELEKGNYVIAVQFFKFPNSNSIKITLESHNIVLSVVQRLFYLFN